MPPENGVGVLDLDLRGDHTGADDSCRVVKGLSRAKHGCRLELCHPVFTRSGVPRASRSKAMHLSDHPKALQGWMIRHSEVQIMASTPTPFSGGSIPPERVGHGLRGLVGPVRRRRGLVWSARSARSTRSKAVALASYNVHGKRWSSWPRPLREHL